MRTARERLNQARLDFTRFGVVVFAVLLISVGTVVIAYQERWEKLLEPSPYRYSMPAPLPDASELTNGNPDLQCPRFRAANLPPQVRAPRVVTYVKPEYTAKGREAAVRGSVLLLTGIRKDGTVGGVCVIKPLPFDLDVKAAEAVKRWRFEPVILNGQPADVITNVTVVFNPDA